jgi:hypothetical protein
VGARAAWSASRGRTLPAAAAADAPQCCSPLFAACQTPAAPARPQRTGDAGARGDARRLAAKVVAVPAAAKVLERHAAPRGGVPAPARLRLVARAPRVAGARRDEARGGNLRRERVRRLARYGGVWGGGGVRVGERRGPRWGPGATRRAAARLRAAPAAGRAGPPAPARRVPTAGAPASRPPAGRERRNGRGGPGHRRGRPRNAAPR